MADNFDEDIILSSITNYDFNWEDYKPDPVAFRRKNLVIKAIRDSLSGEDIEKIIAKNDFVLVRPNGIFKLLKVFNYVYVTITTPIPVINQIKEKAIVTHLPLFNSTMGSYQGGSIDIEMKTVDDIAVEYSLRVAADMEQIMFFEDRPVNLGLSAIGTEILDSSNLITSDGSKMNMLGFWNNLIYAFYIINNNYDSLREFLTSERTSFLIKSLIQIGVSNGYKVSGIHPNSWKDLDIDDRDEHLVDVYRIIRMIPKSLNFGNFGRNVIDLDIDLWKEEVTRRGQRIIARPAFLFAVYILNDMFARSKTMFKSEKILKMIQGDILKMTRYIVPENTNKFYLCLPMKLYSLIDLFDKSKHKLVHNKITFMSMHFLNFLSKLRSKLKNLENIDNDLIKFYGLLGRPYVEKSKIQKAFLTRGIAITPDSVSDGHKLVKTYVERKVSSSQKISLLIYNLLNNNFELIDEMKSVEELYIYSTRMSDENVIEIISQIAAMYLDKSFIATLKRKFNYDYNGMSEFIKEGAKMNIFGQDIKSAVKTLNRLDREKLKKAQAYQMILDKTEPILKALQDFLQDVPKKYNIYSTF